MLTRRFHNFTDPLMISVGYTWMSLLYLCVLLLVVSQPVSRLGAVMRWRWLRWLGSIAYGVYLVHQLVAALVFQSLWHSQNVHLLSVSDAGAMFLALIITLLLCSLSWKYFEKPLVQYGHRSTLVEPSFQETSQP